MSQPNPRQNQPDVSGDANPNPLNAPIAITDDPNISDDTTPTVNPSQALGQQTPRDSIRDTAADNDNDNTDPLYTKAGNIQPLRDASWADFRH